MGAVNLLVMSYCCRITQEIQFPVKYHMFRWLSSLLQVVGSLVSNFHAWFIHGYYCDAFSGKLLQVNSGAREQLFFEAPRGHRQAMRNSTVCYYYTCIMINVVSWFIQHLCVGLSFWVSLTHIFVKRLCWIARHQSYSIGVVKILHLGSAISLLFRILQLISCQIYVSGNIFLFEPNSWKFQFSITHITLWNSK